jgi:predicted DNA-binding transcriptional regulator YafY
MLLLERRGRLSAAALADELEVSERTILRDIEALSGAGVPVFAVRGPGGGFELLGGEGARLHGIEPWLTAPQGRHRAVVRITSEGRRVAATMGWPDLAGRATARASAADPDRVVVRVPSLDGLARRLLALAGEAEVVEPVELREIVRAMARSVASRHATAARR